jgi:cyclophilin family peptidyl-prolyl cis-trans isomerase
VRFKPAMIDTRCPVVLTGTPGQPASIVGGITVYYKYTVAMANSRSQDSAGSQFFVQLGDNQKLDWFNASTTSQHVDFGVVCKGFAVVGAIAAVRIAAGDRPAMPFVLHSVTISSPDASMGER